MVIQMDKYEQFKEWVAEQRIYITSLNIEGVPCDTPPFHPQFLENLFDGFEKSLEKTNRDKQLKDELLNAIVGCGTKGSTVDKVIEVLNKGDYLK